MYTSIKPYKDLTLDELYEIIKLRIEVFINEQDCNYQDLDGTDHLAHHVMVVDNGSLVAYARVFFNGIKYNEAAIGRVITKKTSRGTNLGEYLMKESMKYLTEHGEKEIKLSAQVYAEGFYEKVGFQRTTKEPYLEDNIPHVEMIYREVL
ncbi:MAG: GNAT family N-acetyltransferase [Clostridiaceae bacterium]